MEPNGDPRESWPASVSCRFRPPPALWRFASHTPLSAILCPSPCPDRTSARGTAVVIQAGRRGAPVDTPYARLLLKARGSILMPDPIRLNPVPDSILRSHDVEYHAPVHELRPETFVHDRARNRQIMRIQGVVPLPIGAEIELYDPNVKATVIGVRLLAGSAHVPVVVCLDVDVPEAYWEER
jgi:hypothetical protein